jgi:hypothetical protein
MLEIIVAIALVRASTTHSNDGSKEARRSEIPKAIAREDLQVIRT